jgi:hypothetical protein
MTDIFRDPIWQFIGVVIAVIGTLLTLWLFLVERKRKELSYTIAVNEGLIQVAEEIDENFQILYKGKSVRNLRLLILEIRNSGNIPILPTDYVKPVVLLCNDEANIVSAEIAHSEPKDMDVALELMSSHITFKMDLLNPRDYLRIKILVNNFQTFEVKGRLIGVSAIKQREKRAELIPIYTATLLVGYILGGIVYFSQVLIIKFIVGVIAIMAMLGLIAAIFINRARYDKRVRK